MAHASVASLMRTIESLLTSNSPMQSLICDHREELCALCEKVSSLEVVAKNFEKNNVLGEMADLEVEVKEVASAVEDTIQLRVTEVLENDESLREKAHRLSDSLQQVAEDIDRILKESTKIQDKGKQASKESTVQEFPSSPKDILNVENCMVGRDDQRKRLVEDLTRSKSVEPKVIPIIGMGGIGKTTLANEVYKDACIRSHFDVCAWATVSQQHNAKEILLSLLRSTKGDTFDMNDEAELANMLQKSLKGKRYLIVLDDMWKTEAWDAVKLCFPSGNKGSVILLTTRITEVARDAGTKNLSLQMDLMGPDESWLLFKSVAFSSEELPSDLKTIGKQIAEKCHGLPLTIAVIAGLLKSKRAIADWENVAKDVKPFVTNDPDKQCSRVLGLSYNHLTSGLKTCLLHFGIFPEDSEIPTKKLMRSWMAEGFLKLENDLEREAEKCLQELVDRCLVLVCKTSLDGTKIRSCKVHDLIYDLCVREIQRENIFIMNDIVLKRYYSYSKCRYLSMQKMQPFKEGVAWRYDGLYRALLTPVHRQLGDNDNNDLLKRTRSIFSFHLQDSYYDILKSELIHFKLLKVLELRHIEIDNFPVQILSLIWLRFLSLLCLESLDIPPEICRLWNLQTFIVRGKNVVNAITITFPEEIWGLMQLRHLKLPRIYLPDCPSGSVDKGRHSDFSNLQTISYLSSRCCTKEVIMGIQNVKKLRIRRDVTYSGPLNNLVHLHQLETLSLTYCLRPLLPSSAKAFPATLKKLKLERTFLRWSYLDIIAELPNLEVLKLIFLACRGEEWHPNVRGFARLKLLLIEDNDVKYWKATNDIFPVLEYLVLKECRHLKEIPIEFAEIHTLQLIELNLCLSELGESATRIQKEQEDLGNNPMDVRISRPRKLLGLISSSSFWKKGHKERTSNKSIQSVSIQYGDFDSINLCGSVF
ncbi:putative late blight resistance protein homolog R1A-10 isoform X2 [Capsicum annuum]|uniref:putative late blight resistance protein homolog R1A-10 isoform X2 n=1 Tax=Capsicum annuum TaxID=4072 RepID=UPI001FB17167|nr:putative late blight resistance protein homolog R1A-10 isoform X2 [Capsicum annuum]